MTELVINTAKEVAIEKQDIIPALAAGAVLTILGLSATQWSIIFSGFIAISVVIWKLAQSYVLVSRHLHEMKQLQKQEKQAAKDGD